jgi:hypothetical protein
LAVDYSSGRSKSSDDHIGFARERTASDSVELNALTPSEKVTLDLSSVMETVRCGVALSTNSDDYPTISTWKQAVDALTAATSLSRQRFRRNSSRCCGSHSLI